MEEDFTPGSFGCHEALDRCALLAELVEDFSEHSAIAANGEWQAKAKEAAEALASLYQSIGSLHLPLTGKPKI